MNTFEEGYPRNARWSDDEDFIHVQADSYEAEIDGIKFQIHPIASPSWVVTYTLPNGNMLSKQIVAKMGYDVANAVIEIAAKETKYQQFLEEADAKIAALFPGV